MDYMFYFESFTYRLLRYDDYEDFSRFFKEFMVLAPGTLDTDSAHKILEKIHRFKVYLETTLSLISQRSELKDKPLNKDKGEKVIHQYLLFR